MSNTDNRQVFPYRSPTFAFLTYSDVWLFQEFLHYHTACVSRNPTNTHDVIVRGAFTESEVDAMLSIALEHGAVDVSWTEPEEEVR